MEIKEVGFNQKNPFYMPSVHLLCISKVYHPKPKEIIIRRTLMITLGTEELSPFGFFQAIDCHFNVKSMIPIVHGIDRQGVCLPIDFLT